MRHRYRTSPSTSVGVTGSRSASSFDVVGVNNNAELIEYDHTRLVLAAFVCHLTGFSVIDRAIGGVYEVTMNKTKEL